jgi:glycerol-3-phosphate cytidylyltransferase
MERHLAMRVLTIGTFDLLHPGHVALLERCVELGGERAHVSVGVNTDDFIKRYKGSYPVMSLVERLEMLRAIRWVDDVLINKGNEDCKVLIDEVKPDLLVVGSDWLGKDYLKQTGLTREYLERRNIALVFLPYTVGISTTQLKARLK